MLSMCRPVACYALTLNVLKGRGGRREGRTVPVDCLIAADLQPSQSVHSLLLLPLLLLHLPPASASASHASRQEQRDTFIFAATSKMT